MFSGVFLVGVGVLIWAIATGRIHIGAIYGPPVPGVTGTVRDLSGNPISGVKVYEVRNPAKYALSQVDGRFGIMNLPTGENTLVFQKNGRAYGYGTEAVDVPTNYWAYWEIMGLNANTNGYLVVMNGQLYYKPGDPATRGFIAKVLCNSIPLAPYHKSTPTFKDVPFTNNYYDYIEAVNRAGVMGGFSDGTFKPTNSLTRDQLAVILYRTLKLQNTDEFPQTFPDVPRDHWAFREIETLFGQNIVFGGSDGNFNPSGVVNRDGLAVFITRSFKNLKVSEGGYDTQFQTFYLVSGSQASADIYMTPCGQVGKVTGVVKNASGQVLANVEVGLTLEPSVDESYETQTDANGNFTFFNIPEGYYQYYVATNEGRLYQLENVKENSIYVKAGETTTLDILNLTSLVSE
jgi:hypothetical protein